MSEVAGRLRLLQMYTQFGVGGTERHVLSLSRWLRNRGHCVWLAGAPGEWLDGHSDAQFIDVPFDRVAGGGGRIPARLLALIRCAVALRREIRRHGIQLVHAHEIAPALAARLAMGRDPVPIVLTYHGSEEDRVRWFGRLGRRVARCLVTPSRRTAERLRTVAGVPHSQVEVIGLGIEPAPAVDAERVARLRSRLLGDGGRILVVSVARLDSQKGIDILIKAAARVLSKRPDVRFAVVGDGPQRDDAQRWARESRVSEAVQFVGSTDRVHEYLAASDLFALASRWEALPLTIPEAFRAGLPVVATDVGGVGEMVDSSVGRLIPSGDATPLADAVLEICADAERRRELAAEARRRGDEARFVPDEINRLFERLYERILESADFPQDSRRP